MKPANVPIAFEPPPTQRDDDVGQPALDVEQLRAGLLADHRLQLPHQLRYGAGPTHEPIR